MPSRIAFRVASKMDSRIVLDQNGADLLLGQGDMLFLPPGASKPIRGQGTFIDDKEMKESVKLIKTLADAQYEPELVQIKAGTTVDEEAAKDDLFDAGGAGGPGNQTRQRELAAAQIDDRIRPRQPADRSDGRERNRRQL